MLALKLLLVPGFIALVSLAGRRWGPAVAGWLAGFPIVGGSILFVLALEHGPAFTATAAIGSLSAVFASVSFSVAYAWACQGHRWFVASPIAIATWALASLALSLLPANPGLALALAVVTLLAAPKLFPKVTGVIGANRFDNRELLLRMAVGAALTLAVSALATALGPARSGILSVFPVIGSVLTIFSQRSSGAAFVVTLVSAMVRGLWSFTAFCAGLVWLLPVAGTAGGFAGALLAALIAQAMIRLSMRALRP